MTTTTTTHARPAVLGGTPLFPAGLPQVRPQLGDTEPLRRRLTSVFSSGQLTDGPCVRELEEQVADRLGVGDVVAVASGTAGLALVYRALGPVGPVVLPSLTAPATAHAVHWAGGTPVFADIDADSLTLDPTDAAAAAADAAGQGPGVAAVSATHVHGTPCAAEALDRVGAATGLPVVFDAAHALGSVRRGRPVGSFGRAEVFSLGPSQVVVGGEGGLVATGDAGLATELRRARDSGDPTDDHGRLRGLHVRMSELHAATALHSLSLLDDALPQRRALVRLFWAEMAEGRGLRGPLLGPTDESTCQALTLVVDEEVFGLSAAELGEALRREGIDARRPYAPAVHQRGAYAHLPRRALPVTEQVAPRVLTLPLWSQMTSEQLLLVAAAILRVLDDAEAISSALAREASA